MHKVFFTTSAVVAEPMRNEDDIEPFKTYKTQDEGTTEDIRNIDDQFLHQCLP